MHVKVFNYPPIRKGSGGDCCKYVRDKPVPKDLGGVKKGDTFDGTVIDVLDRLLYPYQYPKFTNFYIYGVYSKEVGDSIPEGNYDFKWNIDIDKNVKDNSITIKDLTNYNTLIENTDNDNIETIHLSEIYHSRPTDHKFRIYGKNTKDETFSRTFTVSWYYKLYYGESNKETLTSDDVVNLSKNKLTSTYKHTLSMDEGGYKYICYPKSFGLASVFKDKSTNLDVAMEDPIELNVTNDFYITTTYYIHRTTNVLNGEIDIIVK